MRKLVPAVAAIAVAAGVVALPSQGAAPKPRQVSIRDDYFGPKNLTVKKGTKIVWTWKGKVIHNVSEAHGKWRSGTKKKGTYKRTFNTRGTYRIVCSIHAPDMHMTVKVK
jgi:plastocyanin